MNRRDKYYVIVNVDNGETQKVLGSFALSENFEVHEFVDEDRQDTVLYSKRHVDLLQAIRDFYKKPLTITSGNREVSFNDSKNVGGSFNSEHQTGHATDIKIQGVTPLELWHKCVLFGGYKCNVGLYPTHVHFGTRGFHRRAR